jgi:hypothetical protein
MRKSRRSSDFSIAEHKSDFVRLLNYILFDLKVFASFSAYILKLFTRSMLVVFIQLSSISSCIHWGLRLQPTERPKKPFLATPVFLACFHLTLHSHVPEPTFICFCMCFAILDVLQNGLLVCYKIYSYVRSFRIDFHLRINSGMSYPASTYANQDKCIKYRPMLFKIHNCSTHTDRTPQETVAVETVWAITM